VKYRTGPGSGRLHPDAPAVLLNDALAQHEPHSGARTVNFIR